MVILHTVDMLPRYVSAVKHANLVSFCKILSIQLKNLYQLEIFHLWTSKFNCFLTWKSKKKENKAKC